MALYRGVFPPIDGDGDKCQCETCFTERHEGKHPDEPFFMSRMILCAVCGCKRCPHATHHDNLCTGSNEPGQPGSSYQ